MACRRRCLDRIGNGDDAGGFAIDRRRRLRSRRRRAAASAAASRSECRRRSRCMIPALPRRAYGPRRCPAHPCRSASRRRPRLQARAFVPARPARWRRQADARCRARGWRLSRSSSASSKPPDVRIAVTAGLPSVSVPVLSTTSVSTFSMRSSASAFLISTPISAPRPTPTMIDIGVASPSAHGQAMMSTDTAATRAKVKRGSGPTGHPGGEGQYCGCNHRGHEPAGHLIGEALDRRAAALGLRHHLHDLRKHGVAADLLRPHDERAGLVDGAADDLVAGRLGHGHGLAGDHGFVDGAAALDHFTVHRHPFAGPHTQTVAGHDADQADLVVPCRPARPAAPSSATDPAAP